MTELSEAKLKLLERWRGGGSGRAPGIPSRPVRTPVPLSPVQRRLWFLERLRPGGASSTLSAAVRLRGPLDTAALSRACAVLTDRHEALRTAFAETDGAPEQVVHDTVPTPFSAEDAVRDGVDPQEWLAERSAHVFDTAHAPLARFALLRTGADEHLLHLAVHHLVADGISVGLMVRDLLRACAGPARPDPGEDAPPPVSFADYAHWADARSGGEAERAGLDYWTRHLDGVPDLVLPTDRPRPARPTHRGAVARFALPVPTADAVRAFAAARGATLYTVLLAGFEALLYRYGGREDFAVGTPLHGRTRPEVEEAVGPFATTVAVRSDVAAAGGFGPLVDRVRATCAEAFEHQEAPFDEVVARLRPDRDPARNPVFQAMFALQHRGGAAAGAPGGPVAEFVDAAAPGAAFDLSLTCWEEGGRIEGTVRASVDLFDEPTAARIPDHFAALLADGAAHPDTPVRELRIRPRSDRTARPVPVPVTLEARAADRGGAPALVQGGRTVAFDALAEAVEEAAAALAAAGIGRGSAVALALPRSVERVTAALALARLGAACAPIDPDHPAPFRRRRAAEAGAVAVLCPEGQEDAYGLPAPALVRPGAAPAPPAPDGAADAPFWLTPAAPRPITQAEAVAGPLAPGDVDTPGPRDTMAWTGPLGTDAETVEVLWPLLNGAAVALPDPEAAAGTDPSDPGPLVRLARRHPVTSVVLPPGALARLLADDAGAGALSGLRALLTSGESLTPELRNAAAERLPRPRRLARPGPEAEAASPLDEAALRHPCGAPAWPGGHRVEAAEVERAVVAAGLADDCRATAVATPDGRTETVVYTAGRGRADAEEAEDRLRRVLPAELVPAAVVPVAVLPADGAPVPAPPVADGTAAERWAEALRTADGVDDVAVAVVSAPLEEDRIEPVAPAARPEREGKAPPAAGDASRGGHRPADGERRRGAVPAADPVPAISDGGPAPEPDLPDLGAVLVRAACEPGGDIMHIRSDGAETRQSYAELLEEAERMLGGLRAAGLQPGDKAVFQFPDNADFLPAFWACQLGGFVPVPLGVAPSYTEDGAAVAKVDNVWRSLGRPWVLCGAELEGPLRAMAERRGMDGLRLAAADRLRDNPRDGAHRTARLDDTALLLLTSGSTGTPKAVTQTHRALLVRSRGTADLNRLGPQEVTLNWIPMDHVTGVVMFHLRDVYVRCAQIHAATDRVLDDPLRWIEWCSRHRVTATWAPNFAFGLVTEALAADGRTRDWDLSALRFIINAGEAVVPRVVRRLLADLAPHGLPADSVHPAWGMSETCSAVTDAVFDPDASADTDAFTPVGHPYPGVALRIVGDDGAVLCEGDVGRLQVRGVPVTRGYLDNPEANAESTTDDGWFDTGDLARLAGGALTITGRAKDVIIVNGVNHHCHEIESVVEELDWIERSYTAACAVRPDGADTDRAAVFFHPRPGTDLRGAALELRAKLARDCGLGEATLVPVEREDVPKTEIGKIQRSRLRTRYEEGAFDAAERRLRALVDGSGTVPDWFRRRVWRPGRPPTDALPDGTWLVAADPDGPSRDLADLLVALLSDRAAGTGGARIAAVAPGDADAYAALLARERAAGRPVDGIVHLRGYGPERGGAEEAAAGAGDLAALVRALVADREAAAGADPAPARLVAAADRSRAAAPGDAVTAERAAALGVLNSAPNEVPWLACRHVDLAGRAPGADARVLAAELAEPGPEAETAHRGGRRLVRRLAPLRRTGPGGTADPIEPGGLYLVTGGLGGVGRRVCAHLARAYGARLLITGRRPLGERAGLLDEVRALGGAAEYAAVDAADTEGMRTAVREAERRLGSPLRGAFHLAGEFATRMVADTEPDRLAASVAAAAAAARAVRTVLAERRAPLLALFSSVNAYFGGAGVGGYAAVNAVLDELAHEPRGTGPRVHALAWSVWEETGMSAGFGLKELTRARGLRLLAPGQATASLGHALRTAEHYVVIGVDGAHPAVLRHTDTGGRAPVPLRRLAAFAAGPGAADAAAAPPAVADRYGTPVGCAVRPVEAVPTGPDGRPDTDALAERPSGAGAAVPYTPASTPMEATVAAILAEVLDVPRVGVHDDFFAAGGHSLHAARVVRGVRDRTGADLPLQVLFEHPTAAAMAKVVEREAADGTSPPDLAAEADAAERTWGATGTPAPAPPGPAAGTAPGPLLTGAVGAVGAQVLCALLAESDAPVRCLVEAGGPDDADALLRAALARRLGPGAAADPRIEAVPVRPGAPGTGLAEGDRARLAAATTAVLNIAADTTMAMTYTRLRAANVDAVAALLGLAAEAGAAFHHLSTPGVLVDREDGADPAAPLAEEGRVAADRVLDSGYVRTRWVAEELVERARRRGVRAAVHRMGRTSGDTATGAGAEDTVFWLIVRAALETGALPAADPDTPIDLTPVDQAARAMVRLALAERPCGAYHLASPHPVRLGAVADRIRATGLPLREAAPGDWRGLLEEEARRAPGGAAEAVAALLASGQGMPGVGEVRLDTANAERDLAGRSPFHPVGEAHLDRCIAAASQAVPERDRP
ncbi:SDR family NAD(P)-dependent oxidoreductase [Nocardiopsis baichengensis]|uniref:SDR family NAD(P)-dependent oxidoreductase n=1 Tax=Nocardiopsis baichengensis TaxID=280240 RepID=UPI00034BAFA6|nr:SDR family NAD(P)-dependent oxidoreductase [Nocardiopsis baichengensis]